jgi:trigger factor
MSKFRMNLQVDSRLCQQLNEYFMATITRENVGPLMDRLHVTLEKADYYPAFEKSLKQYSRQANIPGFRKGMVPMGHIKKMYGASVFTDEILRRVEKEINGYLEQERPEIFGHPLPANGNAETLRLIDMNLPGDYRFSFDMGLRPSFQIPSLAQASIKRLIIDVTDDMLQEEVSRLQKRFGKMTEPETISREEEVLNLHFEECDEAGNLIERGLSHDNSLLVKYFVLSEQQRLKGLRINDSLVIQLGKAFEDKEKEWLINDLSQYENPGADSLFFKLTITKIGYVEIRALDEEFFNEAMPGKAIASEEEFRKALREDLESYWRNQTRGQVHDEIYHYLLDQAAIELPEPFLKRWMMVGGEKEKTSEEVEQEFPAFVRSLKWSMISDTLVQQNNLNVEPEELRAFARQQMLGYMGGQASSKNMPWLDSYVDRMLQDRKYIDQLYNQLINDKLFGWAESQVGHFADEKVSLEEFRERQHHHHH